MESLSPKASLKQRSSSASNFHKNEDIQNIFPIPVLSSLECALYNANLRKASREYCSKLRYLANLILDKLNE